MKRWNKWKTALPDAAFSALAGIILLLATPGFDIWPLAFAAFALLAWVFDRRRIAPYKAAFIAGFLFYGVGISWVHVPMTLFGGAPMWAGALLVVFTGFVGGLLFWAPYGFVWGRTASHLLAAIVFIALEMLKGKYFFGGLPWLNMGQTQYNNLPALQLVSVVGEHGLSLLVILTGVSLFRLLKERRRKDAALLAALMAVMFGFGGIRMALSRPPAETHTARIVQTGIRQEDKWAPESRRQVYDTLNARVAEAASAPGEYDIMVLPETSFTVNPFANREVNDIVRRVSALRPLILSFDRKVGEDGNVRLYNSLALIDRGEVAQSYDKMKLAPFGEYFPFEKELYPIRKFFFGDGMLFSPGSRPVLFDWGELRIIPLICFEGAFSEMVRQRVNMGGNVVVVVSNDAWFGRSLGRVQNLAINAVRAAEYERYVIRVTQDGISALIAPSGEVRERLPEKEFAFRDVHFASIDKMSIFATFGYTWYVLLITIYAVYMLRKRRKRNES